MKLLTAPGDIPGLLRRGSPALGYIHAGEKLAPGVVLEIEGGFVRWALVHVLDGSKTIVGWPVPLDRLFLDLSDRTGCWHAALWLIAESARLGSHRGLSVSELALVQDALWGEELAPDDVEELRTLVLRLAGREDA